jgi:hypothetical protein
VGAARRRDPAAARRPARRVALGQGPERSREFQNRSRAQVVSVT